MGGWAYEINFELDQSFVHAAAAAAMALGGSVVVLSLDGFARMLFRRLKGEHLPISETAQALLKALDPSTAKRWRPWANGLRRDLDDSSYIYARLKHDATYPLCIVECCDVRLNRKERKLVKQAIAKLFAAVIKLKLGE